MPYDVEVLMAHTTRCRHDWRWENAPETADMLNLWYVVDGVGTLTMRDHVYHLRAGDCFVIRLWEYCLGEHDPEHPLTVHWSLYRPRQAHGPLANEELPPVHRHLSNPAFFIPLYERAITAFNGDAAQREQAEVWMSATLLALAEEDRHAPLQAVEREAYAQVQRICDRIRANPGAPVNVAALAEECHYTPGHFTRVFRRYTGLTPQAFITQTRLDAAKSLLYISNYSITRIAEILGYRDVFFFSRHFREHTGLSPLAYRQREMQSR